MAESELFEQGLAVRREVLGADFVDTNLRDTDEFMMTFQRIVTEWVGATPGADRVSITRPAAC